MNAISQVKRETRMTATVVTQPAQTATTTGSAKLNRPCPVCGNSHRERCKRWCAISDFEVLRCSDCGVTFVNEVVDDNFGFTAESAVRADPAGVLKAARDFRRVKAKVKAAGLTERRNLALLDVGCGVGTFLQQAEREGWKVAGLELSPSVAAYAREHNGLQVHAASIETTTGFPVGSFDVITMFGIIEHLAKPRGATEECARLLRPGGILILQTPAEDGLIRRVGHLLYWATGGFVSFHVKQLYQMGGGHSVCFNRRSIRMLLARYGLEILSFEQSTYGFRVLLYRFKSLPLLKKLIQVLGTLIVFSLGRILGGSNHMTVYAQKRASGPVSS
jgi:2-polyprenyl-3-methyl-5-hydroxy-6-metoxy-1,4-benzoquinol methylase